VRPILKFRRFGRRGLSISEDSNVVPMKDARRWGVSKGALESMDGYQWLLAAAAHTERQYQADPRGES